MAGVGPSPSHLSSANLIIDIKSSIWEATWEAGADVAVIDLAAPLILGVLGPGLHGAFLTENGKGKVRD